MSSQFSPVSCDVVSVVGTTNPRVFATWLSEKLGATVSSLDENGLGAEMKFSTTSLRLSKVFALSKEVGVLRIHIKKSDKETFMDVFGGEFVAQESENRYLCKVVAHGVIIAYIRAIVLG